MKYYISRMGERPLDETPILEVGTSLITGLNDFSNYFNQPTTLEEDILVLASSIFAADRATLRGEREDICREIELEIPLVNITKFNEVIPFIENTLRLLSNDAWKLIPRKFDGPNEIITVPKNNGGRTLLFSGGLDSLAAAVLMGKEKKVLEIVSHITRNPITARSQQSLTSLLKTKGFNINHRQFFISSKSDEDLGVDHSGESSQRTRSFLFMAIGAIVARRTGNHKVLIMAENGQMAIHLPLTQGRIGAFSTHTAHPDVIAGSQSIFSKLLSFDLMISNPFIELTKKEVVEIVNNTLPEAIPFSTSCFRNWRLPAGATHCGECIPCFIRRIAIESLRSDETAYARDLWIEDIINLARDDEGRRNLMDLLEFIKFITISSVEEIMSEYPELYSRNIDQSAIINMYKRFCVESNKLFKNYPNIGSLISEDIA